ncbi:MAG: YbaB/EbfC family nucleoid-associated protein [bacterium]
MKLPDITKIIAELREFDAEISSIRVEGESGGGMVKAIVSGKQELLKLEIDQAIMESKDKELLEDLVVAAVNNALKKSLQAVTDRMKDKAFKLDLLSDLKGDKDNEGNT